MSFNFGSDDMLPHESALISPECTTDLVYENRAYLGSSVGLNLPDEHMLIVKLPARDQLQRGTCAAFVGSTISEYKLNIREYMSPEFIYYHRKTKPGHGMYGRDVFNILMKIGSVPEDIYNYLIDEGAPPQPDDYLYEIAHKYRIQDYARVETIIGLKLALLNNEVAYLLLPAYNKSIEFWNKRDYTEDSKGNRSNKNKDDILFYHAVAVIGYNSSGFIFQNSWGEQWGNNGCGCFPYNKWEFHIECWVTIGDHHRVRSLENSDEFNNSSNDHQRINKINNINSDNSLEKKKGKVSKLRRSFTVKRKKRKTL